MIGLISYRQIESNLRRTAEKGLISLINHNQLENLAFTHFGIKDESGNIIGYQCPYSGKIYTDYNDIVLEHIIPVVSNGGTVLFNCIPTSKEVNGSDQKGAKHLIEWWLSSSYWDQSAPLRLEKIVNYMLDGYEHVFKEYTVEEIESSYLDIEPDESILDEEENININARTESKLLKQAKNNGIHSYLGFIYDCVNTLEKNNINTSSIKERLQQLQSQNIFKDIDRYQLYQNIIQKLVVSRIGDNNSSYLTYTLNFDIKKLMDSINLDNEQDIYNELNSRLQNIEQLLKQNNLSIIDYFKNLKDIQDIDIIYKNINNISEQDINIFLENIKIGIDTKIEIFIQMLNKGKSDILKQRNNETLEGYPSIKLSYFWPSYQDKIKIILFEKEKDNPKYEMARQIILNKYGVKTYEELIEKQESNKSKKELDLDIKIEIFIQMLNKGKSDILKQRNNETLEGYPSIKLSKFWSNHQDNIKIILFEKEKDNPKYEMARQIILNKYGVKTYEELIEKQESNKSKMELDLDIKIEIFIQMLNKGKSDILKVGNNETLEGYPSIKLSNFWHSYQDKIKIILFEKEKDNPKYEMARQIILNKYGVKTYEELIEKQELKFDAMIEIFIQMLNKGKSDILKQRNNETLEGYPSIKLSNFWHSYQDKIKIILFEKEKDNPKYEMARQIILNKYGVKTYEELIEKQESNKSKMELDLDIKIEIFIQMLNKGKSDILKQGNNETLEGYPSIKLSHFWPSYQDKIKIILFEKEKDNPKYEMARQTVLTYFGVENYDELEFKSNLQLRISCFIQMLNKGNIEILKQKNEVLFEGYPNIPVGQFWSRSKNREIIIQTLFNKTKDNSSYNTARSLILEYLKVDTIEEYYEKIEKESKKLAENKKIKQQLEETIKMIDEIYGLLNSDEEQRKRA